MYGERASFHPSWGHLQQHFCRLRHHPVRSGPPIRDLVGLARHLAFGEHPDQVIHLINISLSRIEFSISPEGGLRVFLHKSIHLPEAHQGLLDVRVRVHPLLIWCGDDQVNWQLGWSPHPRLERCHSRGGVHLRVEGKGGHRQESGPPCILSGQVGPHDGVKRSVEPFHKVALWVVGRRYCLGYLQPLTELVPNGIVPLPALVGMYPDGTPMLGHPSVQ